MPARSFVVPDQFYSRWQATLFTEGWSVEAVEPLPNHCVFCGTVIANGDYVFVEISESAALPRLELRDDEHLLVILPQEPSLLRRTFARAANKLAYRIVQLVYQVGGHELKGNTWDKRNKGDADQ
ncbi:hypothetical protein Fuma_06693 [Fuerstiella marisgermanici]|uniref:Uncharacterized protein n=1 Tax=Fuerstiella marisgermanici TaxID=1891926 RepID=A0A1P8WSJ4_9PLAN|nr:hypothetical protein Fuma_06693 [Fuerstiella marisgermanici]